MITVRLLMLTKITEMLAKSGGSSFTIGDLAEYLGVPKDRFTKSLWNYAKEGLLKKSKGLQGTYSITPACKKYLASSEEQVTDDCYQQWRDKETKVNKKSNSSKGRKYTGAALSAIESIADVIDANERLLAQIRTIHSMTGKILKESQPNERQESDTE